MRVPFTDGRAEIPFTNPPSDLNTASWLSVAGEKPITQLPVTQKAIWSFGCRRRRRGRRRGRRRRWRRRGMMQLHWQADTKAARCIFREWSEPGANNASANTNLQREVWLFAKMDGDQCRWLMGRKSNEWKEYSCFYQDTCMCKGNMQPRVGKVWFFFHAVWVFFILFFLTCAIKRAGLIITQSSVLGNFYMVVHVQAG